MRTLRKTSRRPAPCMPRGLLRTGYRQRLDSRNRRACARRTEPAGISRAKHAHPSRGPRLKRPVRRSDSRTLATIRSRTVATVSRGRQDRSPPRSARGRARRRKDVKDPGRETAFGPPLRRRTGFPRRPNRHRVESDEGRTGPVSRDGAAPTGPRRSGCRWSGACRTRPGKRRVRGERLVAGQRDGRRRQGKKTHAILPRPQWWARLGLNQRPLPCEDSALPLSYAPAPRARLVIVSGVAHCQACPGNRSGDDPELQIRDRDGRGQEPDRRGGTTGWRRRPPQPCCRRGRYRRRPRAA